jgi:hypothetical protein
MDRETLNLMVGLVSLLEMAARRSFSLCTSVDKYTDERCVTCGSKKYCKQLHMIKDCLTNLKATITQ